MASISPVRPQVHHQTIFYVLICLQPFLGMVVDLISPSLPAIVRDLHSSQALGQNLISLELFGFGLGNFVTGLLTDAWGRRKLLLFNLLGFVLVSLWPVFWPSINVLLAARFLQGLTIGAIAVVARSVWPDILPRSQLVKMGTLAGSMYALGPIIGPLLGGYLQVWFGWKANFIFLALAMLLMLVIIYRMVPETHFNRHPLNIPTLRKNITEVLSHREFVGLALVMGAVYSLVIAFNTNGPFLIQTRMHHSPIFFGHLALSLGCVFMLSTFVCRWLLNHWNVDQIQSGTIYLLLVATLLGVAIGWFVDNSLVLLSLISALMFFTPALIFPTSVGKSLAMFGHIAGTASALMYLISTMVSSAASFLLSLLRVDSSLMLLTVYLVLAIVSTLAYRGLVRR